MAAKYTVILFGMMLLLLVSVYAQQQRGRRCLDDSRCPANTQCVSEECVCLHGYVPNPGRGGLERLGCLDINECTEGTDNCDAMATCTNTDASFTCTCNDGYAGDGVTCRSTAIACTIPPPSGGVNTATVPDFVALAIGEDFTYECLDGFTPYSPLTFTVTCIAAETWSTIPQPRCSQQCRIRQYTYEAIPGTGCLNCLVNGRTETPCCGDPGFLADTDACACFAPTDPSFTCAVP